MDSKIIILVTLLLMKGGLAPPSLHPLAVFFMVWAIAMAKMAAWVPSGSIVACGRAALGSRTRVLYRRFVLFYRRFANGMGAVAPSPFLNESSLIDYLVEDCPSWVKALNEPDYFCFDADPCGSCYLHEWCSDECGCLGFKIDC